MRTYTEEEVEAILVAYTKSKYACTGQPIRFFTEYRKERESVMIHNTGDYLSIRRQRNEYRDNYNKTTGYDRSNLKHTIKILDEQLERYERANPGVENL